MVSLVGAGPGDAGLFTLRGAEVLGRAEVVIYDGLVNRELLRLAPPTAEIIYGGKHDATRCVSQAELNGMLVARARAGKRVVRLKGGDPFVFGRGGEEAEVLAAAGIPFEVVPGVSSVHAVPAFAGIPLTHRQYSSGVTIVTGHEDPASPANKVDWPSLARLEGTLVVLMGLKNLGRIAAALVAHGRSPNTPAAVVSQGSTARQRTVLGTLATVDRLARGHDLRPPAVTIIGDVVNLRQRLDWFERRPLFGRRIAVTQRSDLARPLVAALRQCGAEVLEVPATRWFPHPARERLDRALGRLETYDWILFSNPLGADYFLQRLLEVHGDLRRLGPARLGAYGPRTGQRLREWHVAPVATAADHKTALILEAVLECGSVRGQRFLVLRGEDAGEKVPEALKKLGALVEVVPCYAVRPEPDDRTGDAAVLAKEGADWIVFASGLAIHHFHERFDLPDLIARFAGMRVALASPTVNHALHKLGLAPSAVARPDDVEDLVQAILRAESEVEARATCPASIDLETGRDFPTPPLEPGDFRRDSETQPLELVPV